MREHKRYNGNGYTVTLMEGEKLLAGLSSSDSSDGGVVSRLIGSLLYYMEVRPAPVFFTMTANNVFNISPEIMRKGRFDCVFFSDLHSPAGREQIFNIHIAKSGRKVEDFKTVMPQFIKHSNDFTGAEIEAALQTALRRSFVRADKKLNPDDILLAIEETVPLAHTKKDVVEGMRAWAANGGAVMAHASTGVENPHWSESTTKPMIKKSSQKGRK